jgi:hypothetical protein
MERGERLDKHFGNCADSIAAVGIHGWSFDLRFRVRSFLPTLLADMNANLWVVLRCSLGPATGSRAFTGPSNLQFADGQKLWNPQNL